MSLINVPMMTITVENQRTGERLEFHSFLQFNWWFFSRVNYDDPVILSLTYRTVVTEPIR